MYLLLLNIWHNCNNYLLRLKAKCVISAQMAFHSQRITPMIISYVILTYIFFVINVLFLYIYNSQVIHLVKVLHYAKNNNKMTFPPYLQMVR